MTSSRVLIPARPHRRGGIATLAIASAVLALAGCGSTTNDDVSPAVDNNERTVGNPAVIARIENSTNCTALQREFDIAMDNAEALEPLTPARDLALTYADAANNRMREVGCYG